MILINKYGVSITEESAEQGDFDETWTEYEDTGFTVRELAKTLRYLTPSQSPITNIETVWFTHNNILDFLTGDRTEYTYHYSRSNPKHNLRYWRAALVEAGHLKGTP